jgi:hypothetical protein
MSRSSSTGRGRSVGSLLKMKALGPLGFLAVLAFYVAWPLYAGYGIKSSLEGQNVEGLSAHIDFASVRTSLRPAVASRVDKVLSDALRKAGSAAGALTDQLKARIMPPIVDGVLATLVTPEMLIRIHASGKSLKEVVDGIVAERAGGSEGGGGLTIVSGDTSAGAQSRLEEIAGALGIDAGKALGGLGAKKAAEPSTVVPPLPAKGDGRTGPKYGLGNIKHFSLAGPFGLSVGVARDAAARKPEVTADLKFVDGTWKLTGLELPK